MTLHLGIMGWGTIGEGVGRRIADGAIADVALTAILRQRKTDDGINMPAPICRDLAAFLAAKPDLVLEAAGGDALRALGPQIVENGVSLVVMSAAALGDDDFRHDLTERARKSGARIFVSAGALAGVDALAASRFGAIDEIRIVQRKPPAALLGPDEAAALEAPRVINAASAREIGKQFPKNANIAVSAALAADALDRTVVEVVADPSARLNMAEIHAKGAFGELTVNISNAPSENKRTSMMAIYAALSTIARQSDTLSFGA
ncbi:MAG: hypothetical protein CMM61_07420 [Rhodospirillaceae bacterium]|nr:hypothetical protein [Rhodospirillaceae bacterium]